MFKKLVVIFSILLIFSCIVYSSNQPIFKSYAQTYEVYLNDNSSLATIKRVDKNEYLSLRKVKGESVTLSSTEFNIHKLLKEFSAKVLFTEKTADSKIYYAYSPNIRYQKTVHGQCVNLQIVVGENRVVLGSPLIFGSF